MAGCLVVARVLDDAFADPKCQVQSAEAGVALFKAGDDAQGVQVVVEAQTVLPKGCVESLFAGVAKRWMADVVDQRQGFGKCRVESEHGSGRAGDLGDLKRVGQAAADVIALRRPASEDLSLACEAAKGAGVQNAPAVARKRRAIGVGRFGKEPCGQRIAGLLANGYARRQSESKCRVLRSRHRSPVFLRTSRVNRIGARSGAVP